MSCLLKGMIVPLIPLRLHQFRQFYGGGRISTTALDYDEKSAIITKLYTIEAQIEELGEIGISHYQRGKSKVTSLRRSN